MCWQVVVQRSANSKGTREIMDANKDTVTEGSEKIGRNSDVAPVAGNAADEGEFKIEIRKLEVPVRPRGVLAE
jgi:hypothetical protein